MADHAQLINDIHTHLEESEAYAAYSSNVVRYYRKKDLFTKWIVAVAACGPFVDKLTSTSEDISSWLIALIPLLAIGLPLLNYSQKIEIAGTLHTKYVEIIPKIRELWRAVCADSGPLKKTLSEWSDTLSKIDEDLAKLSTNKSDMPDIKKLKETTARQARTYKKPEWFTEEDKSNDSSNYSGPTVVNYRNN